MARKAKPQERRTGEELPTLEGFRAFATAREDYRAAQERLQAATTAFEASRDAWDEARRREEGGGRPDFGAEHRHEATRQELRAAEEAAGKAKDALTGATSEALPQVRGSYRAEQEKLLQEAYSLWERLHELREENEALRRDYRRASATLPAEIGGRSSARNTPLVGEPAPLLLPSLGLWRRQLVEAGYESFDTRALQAAREAAEREREGYVEAQTLNQNRHENALAKFHGQKGA